MFKETLKEHLLQGAVWGKAQKVLSIWRILLWRLWFCSLCKPQQLKLMFSLDYFSSLKWSVLRWEFLRFEKVLCSFSLSCHKYYPFYSPTLYLLNKSLLFYSKQLISHSNFNLKLKPVDLKKVWTWRTFCFFSIAVTRKGYNLGTAYSNKRETQQKT